MYTGEALGLQISKVILTLTMFYQSHKKYFNGLYYCVRQMSTEGIDDNRLWMLNNNDCGNLNHAAHNNTITIKNKLLRTLKKTFKDL